MRAPGRGYQGRRAPVLQRLVTDTLLWNKAIQTLRTASLVRRTVETRQITIHRLVQAVLKDAMDRATYRTWAERVVYMAALAFPDIKFEAAAWAAQWPICQRYLPHILLCATMIEQEQFVFPEAGQLLLRAARFLSHQSQLGIAKPLYWQALAIFERLPGPVHPDSATCLHNLGLIHLEQGQFNDAEHLLQRALAASEQAFGPTHPYTAKCLNSLAMLYHERASYPLAESFYQRALAILQLQPDPQEIATSGARNNLAEPLFAQALDTYTHIQQLGPAHQRTLRNLTSQALLFRDQAQYELSESLFKRILSAWAQRQDAAYAPDTARSLHGLATLYLKQHRYEEAVPLLTRSLDLRQQSLGPEHPDTAESLHSLALLYREQHNYELAESFFQQALAIRRRIFGPDHPDTAHNLNDLAILHHRQQQDQQVVTLFPLT